MAELSALYRRRCSAVRELSWLFLLCCVALDSGYVFCSVYKNVEIQHS